MYKHHLIFLLVLLFPVIVMAQEADSLDLKDLKLKFPEDDSWKETAEGETVNVKLSAEGGKDSNYSFSFKSSYQDEMRMDTRGNFWWPVDYSLVDIINSPKPVKVTFYVQDDSGDIDSAEVEILVYNREIQQTPVGELKIGFDQPVGWNLLNEGDTLNVQLQAFINNIPLDGAYFYAEGIEDTGMNFDSTGHFQWVPDFDFVDRLQQTRDVHVIFIAEDSYGNSTSEKIVFTVFHKNRPPVIEALPVLYVIQGTNNVFQLPANKVKDPDGDPVVVISDPISLPQGADLTSKGRLTWEPSRLQFNQLLQKPVEIDFFVEDQPYKARTSGKIIVEASKMDLPPEITMIPSDSIFEIREDQFINFSFYIGDPNGDEDVDAFDFVADVSSITEESLIKNTDTQYEFVWEPGYDFVTDPDPSRMVTIRFFAFDQSRNTTEHIVKIKVLETRNMVRIDNENYSKYRDLLIRTLDQIEQLDENSKVLEKRLRKAKKGKKGRAIMSASFGAITGLSPLILDDDPQKIVSGVGGTTVMTMGTLEAKDAIGASLDEIGDLVKINVQLRNKLQNEGDGFARRYNSKSSRRNESFPFDLDKLKSVLNDPEIVKLELDPSWENPKEITDRRLKQAFSDFKPTSN